MAGRPPVTDTICGNDNGDNEVDDADFVDYLFYIAEVVRAFFNSRFVISPPAKAGDGE